MLLLALGKRGGLTPLLTAMLPMSGMFRGAAKFMMVTHLALALLAGLGVTLLCACDPKTLLRAGKVALICTGVARELSGPAVGEEEK